MTSAAAHSTIDRCCNGERGMWRARRTVHPLPIGCVGSTPTVPTAGVVSRILTLPRWRVGKSQSPGVRLPAPGDFLLSRGVSYGCDKVNQQFVPTEVLCKRQANQFRRCATILLVDAITMRSCPGRQLMTKRREMAEQFEERMQVFEEIARILEGIGS